MAKINSKFLPIKAHYLFFFAAMGPILPFLPVFGKQLGISEVIIGGINGTIPLLFLALKPFFGYLIDYFQNKRKFIFMMIILIMGVFFFSMGFIPEGKEKVTTNIDYNLIYPCRGLISQLIPAKLGCDNFTEEVFKNDERFCSYNHRRNFSGVCEARYTTQKPDFYLGYSFWAFVFLMSFGVIAYNISNSISDAICFDVLGDGNEMLYGKQRVWGTIGFGITALIGGYLMNNAKDDSQGFTSIKGFFPALCICGLCLIIDLACCQKLQLPPLGKSENIVKDVWVLIKQPHIATFLVFAVFVGMCDASFIFYLLWFLEDLAEDTMQKENIKLLEGLTIAAETLVGEVVSFYLSGKILSKIGYGHCLSLCLFFYTLRLGLIAAIPSPWWILPIEVVMQGPTYALCYATIVAYASAVAPAGTSATVQGIVAGMDDGFGFALGSALGGVIYKYYGGRVMFGSAAAMAFVCSITHEVLYLTFFQHSLQKPQKPKIAKPDEIKNETNAEVFEPLN